MVETIKTVKHFFYPLHCLDKPPLRMCRQVLFCIDLTNGSFGSDSDKVKFGSGKVRVTQILFKFKFGSG